MLLELFRRYLVIGDLARVEKEQDCSKPIQVRCLVLLAVDTQFWGCVSGCEYWNNRLVLLLRLFEDLRSPEVDNFYLAGLVYQDISRLDVSVHDIL